MNKNKPGSQPSDAENKDHKGEDEYAKGSKTDPQMTELEGLKDGGREPMVHEEDRSRDEEGNID